MATKRSADQVKMKYKNMQTGIFPPSYWYSLSVQDLNYHTIFVTPAFKFKKMPTVGRLDLALKLS